MAVSTVSNDYCLGNSTRIKLRNYKKLDKEKTY